MFAFSSTKQHLFVLIQLSLKNKYYYYPKKKGKSRFFILDPNNRCMYYYTKPSVIHTDI